MNNMNIESILEQHSELIETISHNIRAYLANHPDIDQMALLDGAIHILIDIIISITGETKEGYLERVLT